MTCLSQYVPLITGLIGLVLLSLIDFSYLIKDSYIYVISWLSTILPMALFTFLRPNLWFFEFNPILISSDLIFC